MDASYMKEALELAEKARGYTKTNPLVGAVIVKDNKIIGRGYHKFFGGDHAEVMALKEAGPDAKGATIYVTLEPCCHYGKTPPCTEALIAAGISKVFVAMEDPNPRVAGNGIKILREKGIEVQVGLLEGEARWQNRAFIKGIREKMPYVTLKYGASLDGKIATVTGQSKWITSQESRLDGHKYRGIMDGILVGSQTVLLDNPSLDNRSGRGKNPVKLVLDRELKIPTDYNIFKNEPENLFLFTSNTDKDKWEERTALGAKIFLVKEVDGLLDLENLLKIVFENNIGHILVEGGGQIHGSFVSKGLFDEVILYYAPIILGGREAKSAVSGQGIDYLNSAPELEILHIERIDKDIKIHGVKKCLQE